MIAVAAIGCTGVAPQKAISGEPKSPVEGFDIHVQAPHLMPNGEPGGPTPHHTAQRWAIHSCYCCPPQVVRTIAGLVQTAAHLALLIAGGWLVWHARGLGWPDNLLLIPAVLVQAVFVNALFGAMHESVHYGSFRTRWAADLLAFLSGAAILNNAGFYRHYHMAHHRYTQDPARDPELLSSTVPTNWRQYLLRVSALPFLVLRARDILLFPFGYQGGVDYIHPKAWPEVRRWGR